MVQIAFLGAAGVAVQLATTALAILFLFTQWSPIPAVALSLLAMIAAGTGKLFGSACFAFADALWVRIGGLVTAVACASVTGVPFAMGLGLPLPYDVAWHFTDGLLGLAPGTVKPVYAWALAVMFECVGIAFLYMSGPYGLRPAHPLVSIGSST